MILRLFNQCAAVILSTLAVQTAHAGVSSFLVQNGHAAKCESTSDVGHRAFTLSVESEIDRKLILNLATFVCVSADEKFVLIPTNLATPIVYEVAADIITYQIEAASVAVTNIDGTVEIAKFAVDSAKSTQSLTIDMDLFTDKQVDMTIVGLEVVKKNGQVDDQGLSFGGHFRVINQK